MHARRRITLALSVFAAAVAVLGLSASRTLPDAAQHSAPPLAPPTAPPTDAQTDLSLAFVGDIMAHPINYSHQPYDAIYASVAPVFHTSDLSFANLEFTVDPLLPLAGWPRFNIHPDYVQAAVAAGINVFSDANNHISDYGPEGITSTYGVMAALAWQHGIHFSGIRKGTDEPFDPITIEAHGWRVGFLAVTEFLNEWHGHELVNVVDYREPAIRERFIDFLRDVTPRYDLFVLSVHGGIEYDRAAEPAKQLFFKQALDAGVSIIWSQHPHVLEPWEVVTVNGTQRLIIYSNGNFISGQTIDVDPSRPWIDRAFTGDSAIFRVRVTKSGIAVNVTAVDPVLISNYLTSDGEMVVRPLAELAAADLPEPWGSYYRYRLRVMSQMMPSRPPAVEVAHN